MITVFSDLLWVVTALAGLILNGKILQEALRDERDVIAQGRNGIDLHITAAAIAGSRLRVGAQAVALVGGVVRLVYPRAHPDDFHVLIATLVVIVLSASMVWKSFQELRLRHEVLAFTKYHTSESFLSRNALLEAVWGTVPILIVDMSTGEIIRASRPAEQLFGYQMLGDLPGKTIEVLVPPELRDIHELHREAFAKNPSSRPMGGRGMSLEGLKRDGTRFPIEIALASAVIEGRACVITTVADASGRPVGDTHPRKV